MREPEQQKRISELNQVKKSEVEIHTVGSYQEADDIGCENTTFRKNSETNPVT